MTSYRLPGNGPWRILADCPSSTHNSVRAARAHVREHGDDTSKCVCPRSLSLLAAWRVRSDSPERQRERFARMKKIKLPLQIPVPVNTRMPDLRGGVCFRPEAASAAEAGMNEQASHAGIKARNRAKALCDAGPCPVRSICRSWCLTNEDPPGSWGGVYGGLDPWNRRNLQIVVRSNRIEVEPYYVER